MKVLFYDLETAYMLSAIWRITQDYVNPEGVVHDKFLFAWSAKWRGQKKVHSQVLDPDEALAQNDSRIVEGIADLVREADYVVAHNIDRFDIPVLNGRLAGLRLPSVGPVQTIDTKKLARQLGLASTSLQYLAQFLGYEGKMPTTLDLWKRAYQGDMKALHYMVKYCRKDTRLLSQIFEDLLPYVKGVPRLVDPGPGCVYCGSESLVKWGFRHTAAGSYQKWLCRDCGKYSKTPAADKSMKPELRPI